MNVPSDHDLQFATWTHELIVKWTERAVWKYLYSLPLGHMNTEWLVQMLAQMQWEVKDSIFLKNRHFVIRSGLIKLIYGIDTIIKFGIWQPVKFQLVSRSRTGLKMKWFLSFLWINFSYRTGSKMKWFFLSYLWNNVGNINWEKR